MKKPPKTPTYASVARQCIDAAGGASAVARHFSIRLTATRQWCERGIPATRVLDMEKLTGVSRHVLRPDVFGERG